MYPGSATFNSPEYGKLRFDYEYPDFENFSPDVEKGRFSIWTVAEYNGVELPQSRVSLEKLQEMREKLTAELDQSMRSLAWPICQAKLAYKITVEERNPSPQAKQKMQCLQKALTQVFLMKCMVKHWDYAEIIWDQSMTALTEISAPLQF